MRPRLSITTVSTPRSRAFSRPAAFALSLITTATRESGISPLLTESTRATIFEPRPEMSMPIFIVNSEARNNLASLLDRVTDEISLLKFRGAG